MPTRSLRQAYCSWCPRQLKPSNQTWPPNVSILRVYAFLCKCIFVAQYVVSRKMLPVIHLPDMCLLVYDPPATQSTEGIAYRWTRIQYILRENATRYNISIFKTLFVTSRKRPSSSVASCTKRSENTLWHSWAHSRITDSFVSTVLGVAWKKVSTSQWSGEYFMWCASSNASGERLGIEKTVPSR